MSADHPDDKYDDEAPPRRRRSMRDEDYDRDEADDLANDYDDYAGDSREWALSKVRAPALLMLIGGIISIIGAFAIVAIGIYLILNPPQAGEEFVGYVYGGIGVLCVPYFGVLTYGAVRMKSLRNHQLAMASAILSISSILCLGVCAFAVTPIGIWALIVLLDPEVKREFKRVQRELSYGDEPRS